MKTCQNLVGWRAFLKLSWYLSLMSALSFIWLPSLSNAACSGAECDLSPGLFLKRQHLSEVKNRISKGDEPYTSAFNTLIGLSNAALNTSPNPFHMKNINDIEFGWCGSAGGEDDSLKDLVEKLKDESNLARNLAVSYMLTGDVRYADKAKEYLLAWANKSTVFNVYRLNINFKSASFDGMESGFCNNSWNMALDSIWQTYGLVNFSDVYAILTRNGYAISDADKNQMGNWIRNSLFPATNAGCHAWTRWADAHPSSSAYTRYRSDNHLSWCVAGQAAAAAALNDETLWAYAFDGGSYDDGFSGAYSNPSNFKAQVGYAVAKNGEIYDQAVRASQHKGLFYGNFSLWALSLAAQIAETHKGENYWTFVGSRGGSLITAYDYYSRYGSGDLPPPDPEEKTDPAFFRFLYEMLVGNDGITGDRLDSYTRARDSKSRNQFISQSIGPVSLVTGDLGMVILARPNPPTNVNIRRIERY